MICGSLYHRLENAGLFVTCFSPSLDPCRPNIWNGWLEQPKLHVANYFRENINKTKIGLAVLIQPGPGVS